MKRDHFLDRDWALLARAKALADRELKEQHGWTAAFERAEALGAWAAAVRPGKQEAKARQEELASHLRVLEAFDRLAARRADAFLANQDDARKRSRGR